MRSLSKYWARLTAYVASTPWSGGLIRILVVVSAVVGMVSVGWAGHKSDALLAIVVGSGAIWATLKPDSYRGAAVIAAISIYWARVVESSAEALTWSVVPAMCLLIIHGGLAILTVAARQTKLPARTLLRWGAYTTATGLATTAVWASSRGLASLDARGQVLVTALGFAAIVATAFAVGQRSLVEDV